MFPDERARPSTAPRQHPHPSSPLDSADCADVGAYVWDYLDGEVTLRRRRWIRAHLARCEDCRALFHFQRAFLRSVRTAMRKHGGGEALRRRVLTALECAGFQSRIGRRIP